MDYEIITVYEYYGNNLEQTRQAKLYANGILEYLPEPEWPDEEIEEVSDEDEEELGCVTS
nr:hypothetical protein [Neobacillus sp. Marseille-Q6967]